MSKVGVGIIGAGAFGRKHAAAYAALPHARVVGVYDVDRAKAERLARELSIPKVFDSAAELAQDPFVEAVSVVTPEDRHVAPALAAIEAGKPTLVEKPLALTVADAARIVSAAKERGVILLPGHILRFEIHYAAVYEEVRAGAFGRLLAITARRNRTKQLFETYQRTHPVFETMIHDIDTVLWLAGEFPRRIHAWSRNPGGKAHPNLVVAVLEFPSGLLATLQTFWTLPEEGGLHIDDGLQVVGTDMTVSLDLSRPVLAGWSKSGYYAPDLAYEPILMGRGVGALREELSYFIDCVIGKRQPERVTAEDGLRAVEVAQAIVEAAEVERP